VTFLRSLGATLGTIQVTHSVFALPFALLALVLAAGGWPPAATLGWVLVAMVSARSAAMAVNRIADRDVDAANPRTASRPLATGALSVAFARGFAIAASAVFLLAAWRINLTALALAPLVLAVLFGYSYLKRVTPLAHLGVGLALGLSPLGGWVAGAGGLAGDLRIPLALGAAVLCWVAGFDVIYACQDAAVDRRLGLHSLPARLGVGPALRFARLLHALCLAGFAVTGILAVLGPPWWVALALTALLLAFEHALVRPDDLSRVNVAFFTLNGVVALVVGGAGIVDALA
jgi:4-hydroxybenzoate polyprenyltransferase